MKIRQLKARKVPNSRGQPTIEVTVNGKYTAAAPSGASTGKHEVIAFPEQGVDYCVEALNSSKSLINRSFNEFDDLARWIP